MSSPVAGKFQDHYAVLNVGPNAQFEEIEVAHERLASLHDPQQGEDPDPEKYEAVQLAFEVLSDSDLRRDFDKIKGVVRDERPKFSGEPFFEALSRPSGLRASLLCILYDFRRLHPFTPAVSMRNVLGMLKATQEEVNFALWYLKQRNLAVSDDKSNLVITADGMDFLENNPPSKEAVLQFIKMPDGPVED